MVFLVGWDFLEIEYFPLYKYFKEVTYRFLLMLKQVWAPIPSATNISSAGATAANGYLKARPSSSRQRAEAH